MKSRSIATDSTVGPNIILSDGVSDGSAKEYKSSLIGSKKPNVKKGVNIERYVYNYF